MKRDYRAFLQDILDCIDRIENYITDLEFEDFKDNSLIVDAVTRNLEIIGEATKNIPQVVKEKYSEVPWKEMAGMRDKIIHGYFDIVYSILWETIKNDLPPTRPQIEEILKD